MKLDQICLWGVLVNIVVCGALLFVTQSPLWLAAGLLTAISLWITSAMAHETRSEEMRAR